jgi:RNA-binding protein
MDAAQRRQLLAQAHHLKSRINVGKSGLTEAVVQAIRGHLEHVELLKIRLLMDDAAEVDLAGEEIARRVPCTFVGRVGHVGIFHRPSAGSEAPE